jgi:hypothetical protein
MNFSEFCIELAESDLFPEALGQMAKPKTRHRQLEILWDRQISKDFQRYIDK